MSEMPFSQDYNMKVLISLLAAFTMIGVLSSCSEDSLQGLPSAQERVDAATEALKKELTAPKDGWSLQYVPVPNNETGAFFMLLKFNTDGTVFIKSDVANEEGEYLEDTILYRVDSNLGVELVLESYGVFHFLFEQNQASFGAEFQFLYVEKKGDSLIFNSKSDPSSVRTELVFVPASTDDLTAVSAEVAKNMEFFDGVRPIIDVGLGVPGSHQHLVLVDKNISVFWEINIFSRVVEANYAATGMTQEEVNVASSKVLLNHKTGYYFFNGKMLLLAPLSFELNGERITIAEIAFNSFNMTGVPLCSEDLDATPVYGGTIEGIGSIAIRKTLFSGTGIDFTPNAISPYSVNVFFVFGDSVRSLLNQGIINETFPESTGFIFNYGLTSDTTRPINAIGLIIQDENDIQRTVLREIEPTMTEGNRVSITLKDSVYISNNAQPSDSMNIIAVTDEIFEGGSIYAYDEPVVQGVSIFRLFNPCNNYEFFLVKGN